MRKLNLWLVTLTVALVIQSTSAYSVTLSLSPASQIATPGDTVSLDLAIDGLTAGGADSLGDFGVDIAFDASQLTFIGYTLGTGLGDIGLGEALDFSLGDLGGGIVNVAEVSLLEPSSSGCVFCIPPFLDDIQPASFTLATFDFTVDVLPPGSSSIVDINTVNVLGDGFGLPLSLDGTSDAVIRNPNGGTIPEPTTLALMGLGLAGIGYRRHRSKTAA